MCLVTCGLDIVQVKGPASCSGGFPAVARERLALIQLVGYRPGSSGRWLRFPSCCRPEPALAATTWGRDSYRASTGLALVRFPLGGTRPHCQPGRPLKQDLRREVTWPLVVCRERERRPSKLPPSLARRENANQLLAARAAATRPCSVKFASLIGKEIK